MAIAPKTLVRLEDLAKLQGELDYLRRHASACAQCRQAWDAIPQRVAIEDLAELSKCSSLAWCGQGSAIYVPHVAAAAKAALEGAL